MGGGVFFPFCNIRLSIRPPHHRHRDENSVTAAPLDSALTNCDARNSCRFRFYENCRVSHSFKPKTSLAQSPVTCRATPCPPNPLSPLTSLLPYLPPVQSLRFHPGEK